MILEVYKTTTGYACCEIDNNGEKHSFVYAKTVDEVIIKKGKKLVKLSKRGEK